MPDSAGLASGHKPTGVDGPVVDVVPGGSKSNVVASGSLRGESATKGAHMRRGVAVVLAGMGLAGCGGTVIKSVLAGGPATHGRFATSQASGDYAVAQTAGTVISPSKIQFLISASPAQQASATWDLVCNENSGGVGSKSGQSTVQAPTVLTLPTPARRTSASCPSIRS